MEEQFEKYLTRKSELLRISQVETSNKTAMETSDDVLRRDNADETHRRRFNTPPPPPILIGLTTTVKCNVVLTGDPAVLSEINLPKIPNSQLSRDTVNIKLKYHIRRLRIARRKILNSSRRAIDVHSSAAAYANTNPMELANQKED